MARTTIVKLTDDLDGSDAATTVSFAYNGTQYEIDLNKANEAAFVKAISKYTAVARKVGRTTAKRSTSDKNELQAIRAWAKESNLKVSERGRIAQVVIDAYRASH